jgi:hypothetical protein
LEDTIRVSNSTVTNNGVGFNNAAGTFASRGKYTVDGNGTNLIGVLIAANCFSYPRLISLTDK